MSIKAPLVDNRGAFLMGLGDIVYLILTLEHGNKINLQGDLGAQFQI
jgi:hypothetical protein